MLKVILSKLHETLFYLLWCILLFCKHNSKDMFTPREPSRQLPYFFCNCTDWKPCFIIRHTFVLIWYLKLLVGSGNWEGTAQSRKKKEMHIHVNIINGRKRTPGPEEWHGLNCSFSSILETKAAESSTDKATRVSAYFSFTVLWNQHR